MGKNSEKLNRREFIKKSAQIAAGTAVLSTGEG